MAVFDYNQQLHQSASISANNTSSWLDLKGATHNHRDIPFRILFTESTNATGTLDVLVELSRDGSTVHASLDGLIADVTTNATNGITSRYEQTVNIPIRGFTHMRIKIGGTGGSTPATGTWPSGLVIVVDSGIVMGFGI